MNHIYLKRGIGLEPAAQDVKRRLSVTNLSSENWLIFRLNVPVVTGAKVKKCEQTLLECIYLFTFALITTGAFSRNVRKL